MTANQCTFDSSKRKQRVGVELTKDAWKQIRVIATKKDTSGAKLIAQIVEAFLEAQDDE